MNNPPNPELHTYYDNELGERLFFSCEPIAYDVGGQLIIVSPKFLSDGLSIPAAARPLINTPKAPQWIGAGILHDWLYSRCETHEHISRRRADTLLLLAMKLYGVGSNQTPHHFLVSSHIRAAGIPQEIPKIRNLHTS